MGRLHCFVEIPKGSRNEYEWNEALGEFKRSDDKGEDDKAVCVPEEDPNWNHMDRLEDLSPQLRNEIEHSFSISKQPEGEEVTVEGWFSRDETLEVIDESRERLTPR